MKKAFIISLLNIILLFICFITVAYAWLAMNTETNSSGMQIEVQQHMINLEYTVYKYNKDTLAGYDATEENDAFELAPYDSIILSRNEHLSIIVKLVIDGQIIIDNNPIAINLFCSETSITARSLSNVLEFKIGLFTINSSDANTIYTTAETNFESITNSISFVENGVKNTEAAITVDSYSSYVSDSKLTLYIQFNYNQELVQNIGTISYDDLTEVIVYNPDIYLLELIAEEN